MTPNISTPDTFRPLITYPGITTECIPRTKRAYEAVFNCGGYSVAPPELQDLILRTSLE